MPAPLISHYFTKYCVYYISGNSPRIGLPQDAEIDCFDDNNIRMGAIYFYPENIPLPVNINSVNGIYLYFRTSRFADIMTMLREEKPLYLCFNTVNASGYIGTTNEPVGEQEL
jgi:hypothetical protein